ncbi:NifU family protein [PVC group bacterium]|nr:NifU family protein [PVC group bacterium]
MQIIINVQNTPNPNALKFIVNRDVIKSGEKASFGGPDEAEGIVIIQKLFEIPNVTQVHFFENVISVTQDGQQDWDVVSEEIKKVILEHIVAHDPNFIEKLSTFVPKVDREPKSPEFAKIDEILDRTVRPYLQGDGGDLELISYENHILKVLYQGACGSCPSSTAGTLQAIQGILRDEFDSEIEVITT